MRHDEHGRAGAPSLASHLVVGFITGVGATRLHLDGSGRLLTIPAVRAVIVVPLGADRDQQAAAPMAARYAAFGSGCQGQSYEDAIEPMLECRSQWWLPGGATPTGDCDVPDATVPAARYDLLAGVR